MANYKTSLEIIERNEGGYANDPLDNGGETYCGISRKSFPHWSGWGFIDSQAKPIKNNTFFQNLNVDVEHFYLLHFWNKMQLGNMGQSLANQLLDFGVNSGKRRAIKSLQTALNQNGFKLDEDGIIGRKTLSAVYQSDNNLLAELVLNARVRFIDYLSKKQPHFARGWKRRLEIMTGYLKPDVILPSLIVGLSLFF
jgi:lysozyme family protein